MEKGLGAGRVDFTPVERACLWSVAAIGLVGLNGVFVVAVLFRPGLILEVLANPVSAAFVLEALVMVGVLAFLLQKWNATRLHWTWFVGLALLGSLAFAVPLAVLWRRPQPSDQATI